MSLESFIGLDQGEGMDPASFEKFKERMGRAQAQIAAIKKEEGKQKKKEDKLFKILLHFVKHSHKRDLILLISRCLEHNLPANFILAIVLLGNPEIKEAVGNFLMLEGQAPSADEKAMVFFREDQTLPLKVRIEIDAWMKGLLNQAEETPQKLLKTAYRIEIIKHEPEHFGADPEIEEKKDVRKELVELVAYVLGDFFKQNNQEDKLANLNQFAHFILSGILKKTQENLDNRAFLEGTVED